MINHLQEARQAKGYDSPSYLKRLKMDKVHTQTQAQIHFCLHQAVKNTRHDVLFFFIPLAKTLTPLQHSSNRLNFSPLLCRGMFEVVMTFAHFQLFTAFQVVSQIIWRRGGGSLVIGRIHHYALWEIQSHLSFSHLMIFFRLDSLKTKF